MSPRRLDALFTGSLETAETGFLADDRVELIDGYPVINLNGRRVEVYTDPGPDGYASRTDCVPGMNVPLVIDGAIVGQIAVADILPS